MVHPAASAGATLRDLVDGGSGRDQPANTDGFATQEVLPFLLFPLEVFQNLERRGEVGLARRRLSALDSQIGAPISVEIAAAISSYRLVYSANIAPSNSTRSATDVWEKLSNAALAAATAFSTSAAVPMLIVAKGCSVAGLMTSRLI